MNFLGLSVILNLLVATEMGYFVYTDLLFNTSVTMSEYGHSALNIHRAHSTDILRSTQFCVSRRKMVAFPAFFPINVENCALSSIC